MTKRYRDFGAGKGVTAEPLSFKLHDEEFNCTPQVQGRLLLDLVAKSNNAEDPAIAAQIVTEFFEQVLTDESYVHFDALMHEIGRAHV